MSDFALETNMNENNKKSPIFEDIKVSTKTIIAVTNWNININLLFKTLPITNFTLIPKKRGRKKKEEREDPNKDIPSGSIITLEFGDEIRGVDLKQKKRKKKKGYFRNSLTVVMIIDNKQINFKISKNGKFQLTGCKNDYYAESSLKYIWKYISESENKDEIIQNVSNPEITFLTVMTNIDFNLGFNINRENLDKYINCNTDYNSLLETSFGYTGVNIKIPMKKPSDMILKKLRWKDGKWEENKINYKDYLETLTEKEKEKEQGKNRYNTFLVFHSGNVIMSSMHQMYMKDTYNKFINIIQDCRKIIEERID